MFIKEQRQIEDWKIRSSHLVRLVPPAVEERKGGAPWAQALRPALCIPSAHLPFWTDAPFCKNIKITTSVSLL